MAEPKQDPGTEALPRRKGAADVAFKLYVISGPDAGASLLVAGPETRYLVGTSEACALRLHDRSVSRRHFAATVSGGALRIEDLESTNGVVVSGLRVFQAEMNESAQIRIGGTVLMAEAVGDAPGASGLDKQGSFGRLLGGSPVMRRLYPVLTQLAASRAPALVEGEAGTGKELLAEVLHEQGPRPDGPFVVCDATEPDVDALLFGTKGSPGQLERADGGTLLVKDLGDLPRESQERLLAFLERRPVQRADRVVLPSFDVRVIGSSRRDLDLDVERGRVLEGLAGIFARARVELPPLRVREGDLKLLADFFWRGLDVGDAVLAPMTLRRFEFYRWPGNVRELQRTVVKLATTGSDAVDPEATFRDDAKAKIGEIAERLLAADLPLVQARTLLGEEFDRRYLLKILAVHGGNVSRAAGASGIARRYFHRLKAKHGIPPLR
jgi:two-component system, NtrC family, response regulator HydG